MAAKPKKSTGNKSTIDQAPSNVTRIKATDSAPTAKIIESATQPTKPRTKRPPLRVLRPLIATGGYFKGAWYELLQVRWPNRRATWSLTGAVLIFSAFFTILIVLLDALFKYLFELILK